MERGSKSLAVKSGFWYVFSTFATKGLAFITTPIFTRLMTKSDYGEFINFANWQSLLIILVSFEMYNTLSRAYYDFPDDYDRYASSITIAGAGITLVFYLFFLTSAGWIYGIVSISKRFVHLMFFTMLFQGIRQSYLAKERTLYRYRSVAVISIMSSVIPTLISVLAVALVREPERLAARMYGFYVPYALVGVYCAADLLRKGRSFKWRYIKYALVLALPLLVHYLTTYLLVSTNVIITKSVLGAEAAALVSITTSITNVLTILFQAVTGAMMPWIMDELEERKHSSVRKCILLFSIGSAAVVFGVMLLGPEVIIIMGGSKYTDALPLLPGLLLAVFIQILSSVFTIILTFDKNVVGTAISTAAVAVLSIAAKILLLPGRGYQSLPTINVLALLITLIVNYFLVRKAGYKKCVDFKAMLLIAAALGLAVQGSFFLYEHTLMRFTVIGIMLVTAAAAAFLTKDKWLGLVSKKKSERKTLGD